MFDADSELPYYYNNVTQETIWELPEDMAIHPTPLRFVTAIVENNATGLNYICANKFFIFVFFFEPPKL
jgi:hypothetical protein